MPIDMWVVLAFALAFFAGAVPILVFLCVQGETWGEDVPPLVRWIHNRRIKAFAAAAASSDFAQAEVLVERVMGRSPIGIERSA
jgi:hypothetical protein